MRGKILKKYIPEYPSPEISPNNLMSLAYPNMRYVYKIGGERRRGTPIHAIKKIIIDTVHEAQDLLHLTIFTCQ